MELFERVREIPKLFSISQPELGESIGVNGRTFEGYLSKKRENNLWPLLSKICAVYPQINRDWLVWDEGPMLKEDFEERPAAQPQQALAAIGFASCGINGWAGKMTHSTVVTAPHLWPDMFCVIASGESMIPEGIGHGHYVFCAPNLPPVAGECVYVETTDGKGALKRFLGEKDIKGAGAGIHLLGWLDKDDKGKQKPFELTISKSIIKTLAPVVYVQRRV